MERFNFSAVYYGMILNIKMVINTLRKIVIGLLVLGAQAIASYSAEDVYLAMSGYPIDTFGPNDCSNLFSDEPGAQDSRPETYTRQYKTNEQESRWSRKHDPVEPSDIVRKAFEDAWESLDKESLYLNIGSGFVEEHGGCFEVIEVFETREAIKSMNSYQYALKLLGNKIEAVTGNSMDVILGECSAYGIDYFISQYFDAVDLPEDGDLVIYEKYQDYQECLMREASHAGVYRARFIDGVLRESVQSKWDFWNSNRYAFEHDLFLMPIRNGDVARFYRVKDSVRNTLLESDSGESTPLLADETFDILENGMLVFVENERNKTIRKTVDSLSRSALAEALPEIEYLKNISFFGVCSHYAFAKVLKTYRMPNTPFLESYGFKIVEKYFDLTTSPKKGDLVVYGAGQHYGIYLGDNQVESKWGSGAVYRHPIFYTPFEYTNWVRIYTMKPEWDANSLREELASIDGEDL